MSFPLEHPDDDRFFIENVEPLIVGVEQQGAELEFRFQCPLTDYEVVARIQPGKEPSNTRPALYGLLENALRGSSKSELKATVDYSVEQIEEAACDAFESVSDEFLWDGARWTHWEADDRVVQFLVYSEALEDLTLQQRALLRKVLEAVAAADGVIEASEARMLSSLLGDGSGPGSGQLPSINELREIKTRTQACALVCFGYAIACVDGVLSDSEEDLLSVVCDAYGLGTLKQWELKRVAQSFVVDEEFSKISEAGRPSNQDRLEVYKFGLGLGLTKEEVRELEWRFLKRSEM